jgi:hypothetical protein
MVTSCCKLVVSDSLADAVTARLAPKSVNCVGEKIHCVVGKCMQCFLNLNMRNGGDEDVLRLEIVVGEALLVYVKEGGNHFPEDESSARVQPQQ